LNGSLTLLAIDRAAENPFSDGATGHDVQIAEEAVA
jgi:hypothetical protein